MEKVDIVMVGCEAVVESGGVVNAIGSCQIAMLAHAFHKPVHVLAERCVMYLYVNVELTPISVTNGRVYFHSRNTISPLTTIIFCPLI